MILAPFPTLTVYETSSPKCSGHATTARTQLFDLQFVLVAFASAVDVHFWGLPFLFISSSIEVYISILFHHLNDEHKIFTDYRLQDYKWFKMSKYLADCQCDFKKKQQH